MTIWNDKDECVARLGDGKGLQGGGARASRDMDHLHPDKFFAPHAPSPSMPKASIYVVEWVGWGRVRKFRHTPA